MISVAILSHASKSEIPVTLPHKALLYGVAACFLWPTQARCLSVGEAQLLSHLGQKLEVRIPIELTTQAEIDDAAALSARIMPPTDQASDPGFPALASHSIRVHLSGGQGHYVAELSSDDPIPEPIGMLRLDVRTANVRLLHEVPLIFDPAPAASGEMVASQPAAAPRLDQDSTPAPQAVPGTEASIAAAGAAQAQMIPRHQAAHSNAAPIQHRIAAGSGQIRSARSMIRHRHLKRFRLAHSFDSYLALVAAAKVQGTQATAPAMDLKRFQLTLSFDSFAAQAPSVPVPVVAAPSSADDARAASAAPMWLAAPDATRPAGNAAAPGQAQPAPVLSNEDKGFSSWRWWCIACLALLNLGAVYRRRSGRMANRLADSRPRILPAPRFERGATASSMASQAGPQFQNPSLARS